MVTIVPRNGLSPGRNKTHKNNLNLRAIPIEIQTCSLKEMQLNYSLQIVNHWVPAPMCWQIAESLHTVPCTMTPKRLRVWRMVI